MRPLLIIHVIIFLVTELYYPQTWLLQNANIPSNAIAGPFSPVNEDVCWASWSTSWTSTNVFINGYLRTTDGGLTWLCDTIPELKNGIIFWIEAIDSDTAYIAVETWKGTGMQGLYKTTNGGVDWQKHPTLFSKSIFGPAYIHFFDKYNGIVVGEPNPDHLQIYTTTNGGAVWTELTQAKSPVASNHFLNPVQVSEYEDCIWISTQSNDSHQGPKIFRTTDKGYTWETLQVPGSTKNHFIFPAFKDENRGIVVVWSWAEPVSILKETTDGGKSWKDIPGPYGGCIPVNISYIPGTESTYVIVGDKNVNGYTKCSAYTVDGGKTWINIDNKNYCYLVFSNSDIGWCTSWTTNKFYKFAGTLTLQSEFDRQLFEYSLEQNYPNPYNPSTTILYSVKERGNVRISIHNAIGEEIATLINEEKNPGDYQITFNANSLSSGIYFYSIEAGNYTAVRKMILLK